MQPTNHQLLFKSGLHGTLIGKIRFLCAGNSNLFLFTFYIVFGDYERRSTSYFLEGFGRGACGDPGGKPCGFPTCTDVALNMVQL